MDKIIYKHFKISDLTDQEINEGLYMQHGSYYHAGRLSLFDYLGCKNHKHYIRFHDVNEYGFISTVNQVDFFDMIRDIRLVSLISFPDDSEIVQNKPKGLYGSDGNKTFIESETVKSSVTDTEVITYKRLSVDLSVYPSKEVEDANEKNAKDTIYLADRGFLRQCDLYNSRCVFFDGHLWAEKKYKIEKNPSLYSDYAIIEDRAYEPMILDDDGLCLNVNSITIKNKIVTIEQDLGLLLPVRFLLDGDYAYGLSLQDSYVTSSSEGEKKYVEKKVFNIDRHETLLSRF